MTAARLSIASFALAAAALLAYRALARAAAIDALVCTPEILEGA